MDVGVESTLLISVIFLLVVGGMVIIREVNQGKRLKKRLKQTFNKEGEQS